MVHPGTGFVYDGINRTGDGTIDYNWAFTYCQGVYIGAHVEMYKINGDQHHLHQAEQTARTAMERMTDDDGILKSEGNGDGGLFKGIFVRYLGELILTTPDTTTDVASFLRSNANSVWKSGRAKDKVLFGDHWDQPPKDRDGIDLSIQLSATMLLEQMAKRERHEH